MNLQMATELVKQGQEARAIADRERKRLDTKRQRKFVEQFQPRMVKMLDARIQAAAHCSTPYATVGILDVDPRASEPPFLHECALFDALRAHYEAMGFTVLTWTPKPAAWGSIQVSGWMESHCG
jgi:hypothetical protein